MTTGTLFHDAGVDFLVWRLSGVSDLGSHAGEQKTRSGFVSAEMNCS